ncbi:MAG: hypothetical protein DHS20C18_49950 [Saprospiraceae bacterium]|nr:MAG: hypothetical protein DHS20C18_49950 [Saprospiraceae bacterium]
MKITFSLLFGLIFSTISMGQNSYFQQEVNYQIAVTLNDINHTLRGTIEMEYTNNAPQSLEFIYLHLWANAFKDRSTAFAQQKLRTGSTRFYFAEDKHLGNFSELDFTVDGNKARLELDPHNPDIAKLYLPQPLASGATIHIASPFLLKIPASFSRLGHVGESYQLTQWFPKPAVYDAAGWHAMPYLDMGEFYSEFGNFEVEITLPENYVVGASGVLQTESEQTFLAEKVKETIAYLDTLQNPEPGMEEFIFPPSSAKQKTIRYTAEKVHDFAWFADKRFRVIKSQVDFPSGRTVDTWVMFTKTNEAYWKNAINYVDRSVRFYSDLVGEYPYPQATAVQSALSAGGGMEYPMITVIGYYNDAQGLDEVITHEVGHNWFYGILGFNERDHPWMDEGINSYYDHRYTERYYEKAGNNLVPEFLMGDTEASVFELGYLYQARRDRDQAPETTSDEFVPINYWLGAYEKPAVAFKYLEKYLGTATFDPIMQDFYQKWAFKHPQPADLRAHFAKHTDKNLDWFFDGFINSNAKMDYALTSINTKGDSLQLTVKNRGDIPAPFPISGKVDTTILHTQWYEGFLGKKQIAFPTGDYDLIVLDARHWALEVNRKNNNIRPDGLFKKVEPLQLKILGTVENDKRSSLYFLPYPAYNQYDGGMLGLAFYNRLVLPRRLEFALAPAYGFKSKDLTGLGSIKYHWFWGDGKKPQQLTLGLTGRHYSLSEDYDLSYSRILPFLEYQFKNRATSKTQHTLRLDYLTLFRDYPIFGSQDFEGIETANNRFLSLEYTLNNQQVINPNSLSIRLEHFKGHDDLPLSQGGYLKLSLEGKSSYTYAWHKNIDIRAFAGFFPHNDNRNRGLIAIGAFNLSAQGNNDYLFDEFYFGRFENEGLWSQQIHLREGGMRYALGGAFQQGRSNNFILALNLEADLPIKLPLNLPLRPYLDLGYFDNAMPTGKEDTFKDQFIWTGGFSLVLIKNILAINFPIASSKNIQNSLAERGNYFSRITFTLDLNQADPWKLMEKSLLRGN